METKKLWTKPAHTDMLKQARIENNEHVSKDNPDSKSFGSFWSKHQPNLALFSFKTTRKQRRYLARFLYHKMTKDEKATV